MTNTELAATIAAVIPAAVVGALYLLWRYAALARSVSRYAQASWPEEEARVAAAVSTILNVRQAISQTANLPETRMSVETGRTAAQCSPEERTLAEAVLRGDRAAACALADKIREA